MNFSAFSASLLRDSSPNNLQMFRDFMHLRNLRNTSHTKRLQKQRHLKTEGQTYCITSEKLFGWFSLRRYSTQAPRDDETNYYKILGVTRNCSKSRVKVAYYKLSKKYHPDVNKTEDAKVKFQKISEAYDVLSSNLARQQYDRKRETFSPEYRSNVRHGQDRFNPRRTIYPIGKSSDYNFDEWHERHYSSTLEQHFQQKFKREGSAKILNDLNRDKEFVKTQDSSSIFTILITIMCSVGAVLTYFKMKMNMAQHKHRRKDIDTQS